MAECPTDRERREDIVLKPGLQAETYEISKEPCVINAAFI